MKDGLTNDVNPSLMIDSDKMSLKEKVIESKHVIINIISRIYLKEKMETPLNYLKPND